jgi:hypothetical protein
MKLATNVNDTPWRPTSIANIEKRYNQFCKTNTSIWDYATKGGVGEEDEGTCDQHTTTDTNCIKRTHGNDDDDLPIIKRRHPMDINVNDRFMDVSIRNQITVLSMKKRKVLNKKTTVTYNEMCTQKRMTDFFKK